MVQGLAGCLEFWVSDQSLAKLAGGLIVPLLLSKYETQIIACPSKLGFQANGFCQRLARPVQISAPEVKTAQAIVGFC